MAPGFRLFFLCLYALGGGAAFAQAGQIPKELLDLDFQRCVTDCEPGFGAATCQPLCRCTVSEFQKRMDFSKYLDLSAQLSRGELGPENRKLLNSIATHCTAELDKSGVVVGTPSAGDTTGKPAQ